MIVYVLTQLVALFFLIIFMLQVYDMGWRYEYCGDNFMKYFMKHYESMDGCVDWITNILTWFFVITLLICTPWVGITIQVLFCAGWPARKPDTDDDQNNDEEIATTEGDPLSHRYERDALLNTRSTNGASTPNQS